MSKPIPKHLQKVINEIFRVEGGYNPVDRDHLPCLKGITAAVWADWLNTHPELNPKGMEFTPQMAADDLRAIAGKGGKPYSNLSDEAFTKQASQITYDTFFTKPGFDKINSPAIQQYIMEISFHRGPGSAQWALNYATGVEHRHADPLLPKGLGRSPERKDAVAHANGFLSTGRDDTKGTQGAAVNLEAEERLYGRLRTAKLIQESHFIGRGNPRITNMALGLFRRAFEFDWAVGNQDDPGLVAGKDDAHLKIYNQFKNAYDDYAEKPTRTARNEFTTVATITAEKMLADPTSPLHRGSGEKPTSHQKPAAPEPIIIAVAHAKPAPEAKASSTKPMPEANAPPTPKAPTKDTAAFDKLVTTLQIIQKQIPKDEKGLERIIIIDSFKNNDAAIPPPQPIKKPAPAKPAGNQIAPTKDELGYEMLIRDKATRLPVEQDPVAPTSAPRTPARSTPRTKTL